MLLFKSIYIYICLWLRWICWKMLGFFRFMVMVPLQILLKWTLASWMTSVHDFPGNKKHVQKHGCRLKWIRIEWRVGDSCWAFRFFSLKKNGSWKVCKFGLHVKPPCVTKIVVKGGTIPNFTIPTGTQGIRPLCYKFVILQLHGILRLQYPTYQ